MMSYSISMKRFDKGDPKMKKFLSFAIVAIMLTFVLVTVATAANALPNKGYLLTDFGQQHWFLGNEATKAPDVTDGKVGTMEYGFAVKGLKVTDMVNETYPSDNWTKTNADAHNPAAEPEDTFDLYASYDADNLYLAVVVHDSHWADSMYSSSGGYWLQGDEVYLDIGHYTGPEMVRTYQRIRFRMYSAGVDFYNASGGGSPYESVSRVNHQATKDVDGRAFYAATTENGELANMQGVVTGYSFSSSLPLATGRGSAATLTYEISINKTAFQALFANSDFMNETPGYFYFAPLMKVVGVVGTGSFNRSSYGLGWYSLDGKDTTKFTDAFWSNFTSKNTKLPQVMFVGEKSEYKTLLGSYYEECTEHTNRGVYTSDTTYKMVCTKCGHESAEKSLPTKGYLLTDYGQQHWFLGNEATKAPDVTDGAVRDTEYSFAIKGLKVTDMVNETYPNDNWTKTHDTNFSPASAPEDTFDLYASYDANNLYLAVVVHDSHWMDSMYHTEHGWLQGDEVYLNVGHYASNSGNNASLEMTRTRQYIRFRMYSAGVDFYNHSGNGSPYESVSRVNHQATNDVDGRAFYVATPENGELANMQGVVTGYSFSSSVPVATGRGSAATVTYEISINKTAFRNCFSGSEFMNESPGFLYFSPIIKVVGVAGSTPNRANYGLGWYSLNGNDTTKFTSAFWANFANNNNSMLPQVMFLGQKSEYKTLLGSYYEDCTEHEYRYILASDTQHKEICMNCGYSTEATDHSYDDGVVTTQPTNAKDGVKTYTCVCGATKTEAVDKLGPTNPENKGKNSYKIMGSNILKVAYLEKETPTTRFNDIMNAFKSFNPDIFGLQECDALWHDVLDGENGFKTLGYAQALTGFGDVDNPIYYKADKFEVLDCGLTKYNVNSGYFYTWALFEVKETGEQFIVSCTHFTWMDTDKSVDTAEAEELVAGLAVLEAKYGVPVIAVGDYNSTMAEEAYTVMTDAYSSARDYAAVKVNMDYRTMVKPGQVGNAPSTGTFVLDHIFYTKDKVIGEKYEVFIGPEAYAYSDHLPHMLTFKLLHEHTFETYTDNGETHTGICSGCKQGITEAHNYKMTTVNESTCKGVCACGKTTAEREHVYDIFDITDTEHTLACACGKSLTTEAHRFGAPVITRVPSYTQTGEKSYTCEVCGGKKKEEMAKFSVPESGYELSDFGQKHFALKYEATEPAADGVIGKDEYTLSIENMDPAADASDGRFFVINSAGRIEEFNIYGAHGDDYVAVAAKIKVGSANDGDFMAFDLGFKSNTDSAIRALIKYKSTGATISYGYDGAATYVKSYTAAYADGYITYELILDRYAVEEYAGQSAEKVYLRVIGSAPVGSGTKEIWFGFEGKSPLTTVHTATSHGRYAHVLELLAYDPEEIFEVEGQKHTYVGEATTDAPVISGDSFDSTKYNEVAELNVDNAEENDSFIIGEGVNIGRFKIYVTYDDSKIYLAAEIDDKDFTGSESTTFTIHTIFNEMNITLGANGTLTDERGVVCENGHAVFTTDTDEGSTVVYALELDRAAVMLASTWTLRSADKFNLSVVNNDDTGTVEYGVADGEDTVGHTVTLSEDPSSDRVTEGNGTAEIPVIGSAVIGEASEVISVNLVWDIPVFTYVVAPEWDKVNHKVSYENGVWSTDPATITVTNHSNQDISASFSFLTKIANSGIVGKFTSDEAGAKALADNAVTLESAATFSAATESTAYFFVTGGVLTADHNDGDSIGEITVTIAGLGND